jgi:hypothetical protein
MGLNSGVFFKTGAFMGTDFRAGQSDGFTGVFWKRSSGWHPHVAWYYPEKLSKTILSVTLNE